jgi:DNA polymerase-1
LMMPWYEADDIIASITKRFSQDEELLLNIFSADKDLKQLLTDRVIFTDPAKWITYKTLDFLQEFWFEPQYILDYLSLIWDSADNIKWVPWIWPKWASSLIQKYHTIENIYENIDKIWWSTKEKLLAWREYADNAKQLISLEYAPEIELFELNDFKLDINFQNYEKYLVQEKNFWSLSKTINDLKNKYLMPQQNSLF